MQEEVDQKTIALAVVLRILFCMVYPLLFSYFLIQQVVPVWYCSAVG